MTSRGYSLMKIPNPDQPLVHVYPDPEELGRVYRPELAIQSGSAAFVRAARRMPELESAAWRDATAAAHADFLAYNQPTENPGRLQLGQVVAWLNKTLPPETIMTHRAGNYATSPHRFYRIRRFRSPPALTSGPLPSGQPPP